MTRQRHSALDGVRSPIRYRARAFARRPICSSDRRHVADVTSPYPGASTITQHEPDDT
jgi:hypothetical protein